jgi:hypothetical protein
MFNNWFRPDVIELEKRVEALERALNLVYQYTQQQIKRNDQNVMQLDENMHNLVHVLAQSARPFPGTSTN